MLGALLTWAWAAGLWARHDGTAPHRSCRFSHCHFQDRDAAHPRPGACCWSQSICISHSMSLCKGTSLRNSNNLVTSSDLCVFPKPVWWPKKCSKTGTGLVFQMDSMRYLNNFSCFCFACFVFSSSLSCVSAFCHSGLPFKNSPIPELKKHKKEICSWKASALGTTGWGCVSPPWGLLRVNFYP